MFRDGSVSTVLRFLTRLPDRAAIGKRSLDLLRVAWGNNDYAAAPRLLALIVEQVVALDGPLLECGSGLSTLVIALSTRAKRTPVHVLEHDAEWCERVSSLLGRANLEHVQVHHTPLADRGDRMWYDLRSVALPSGIEWALCDGPPAWCPGGRSAFLTEIGGFLGETCQLVVDDVERPAERRLLARWQAESDFRVASTRIARDGRRIAILKREKSR